MARIVLDSQKCQGHGRCYSLSPEQFDADELGHAVVRKVEIGADEINGARLAAANCPESAIEVEED